MDQDKDLQNHTNKKDIMPAWYYDAFVLRMAGIEEKVIAERVGKSYSHVRSLFAKSGRLYEFWRAYVEQRKSGVVEEALDMFFAHLPDTARMTIIRAKEGRGMVGIEAARDIFSYTLGKPKNKVELEAQVGIVNFTDWAIAQAESIKQKKDAARRNELNNTTERPGEDAAGVPAKS